MRRINGMLIRKISPVGKRFMFLAYRQYLWIGANHNSFDKKSDEIMSMILEGHPQAEDIGDLTQHGDLIGIVSDTIRDAVIGQYDRETRIIWLHGSDYSVRTSPLIRKVVETLGARTVSYEGVEEKTRKVKRSQIRGDWNWSGDFYHGTSTKYFEPIARLGLKPVPGQTNYPGIHHDELIFLTSRFDEAQYHAFNTARGGELDEILDLPDSSDLPMVVVTKVPDPQRVVPDFDVDSYANRSRYEHDQKQWQFYSVGSEKASKHAGLFGYKGRIPSKFFTMILIWSPYGKKWLRIVPVNFSKIMQSIANWGDDFWTSRYGTFSEEDDFE